MLIGEDHFCQHLVPSGFGTSNIQSFFLCFSSFKRLYSKEELFSVFDNIIGVEANHKGYNANIVREIKLRD